MKTFTSVFSPLTSILGRISYTSRSEASLKGISWCRSRWSGHSGRCSYTNISSLEQNKDSKDGGRGNWRKAGWKGHKDIRYFSDVGDNDLEGRERIPQERRNSDQDRDVEKRKTYGQQGKGNGLFLESRSRPKKLKKNILLKSTKGVKTDRLIVKEDRGSFGQHDAEDKIQSNSPLKKQLSNFENKQNGLSEFSGSYTAGSWSEDISSGVDGIENLQELTLPLPTFDELLKHSEATDINGEQAEYSDNFSYAARCKKIEDFIVDFRSRSTCTKKELLQLMGYINFISRLMPSVPKLKSYLSSLSSLKMDSEGHIQITEEIREDICMWLYIISMWNGGSFANNSLEITSDALNLHTDASSIGYGGYFQGHWFSEQWESECNQWISSFSDPDVSMTFREMYPIVVSAILWGHLWKRKRVLFMCDSLNAIQLLTAGKSGSEHISPLVRQLTVLAVKHNFTFMSAHVPGRINAVADSLSRMQIDRFRKYAPDAQTFPCTVPYLNEVLWNSSMIIWEK